MSFDNNSDMREFMALVETYVAPIMTPITSESALLEEALNVSQNNSQVTAENPLLEELRDLVFKLRAHMDEELEPGFERAAEMIENLIKRHEGN